MKMSARRVVFAAILFGALTQPAAAFDLEWLNQSPARYFTDEDWKLSQEASEKALETVKDGETLSWKNPASGANGTYTPVSTTTGQDGTCREVKIFNHAGSVDATSFLRFCQQPDGKWALVGDAPPK